MPEAADVLAEHRIGAAPVVDGGKLVGLLRDEDLIVSEAKLHVPTVIEFLGAELVVAEVREALGGRAQEGGGVDRRRCDDHRVPTVSPSDSIEAAATLMHDGNASHVCVTDGDRLVGIVARGDLVRYLAATT